MDAFDTMGLAPKLDLDASELEARYRDLQKQLHPDKHVQTSMSQRRASLARAVNVNDAYRALRDDLKRAEILFVRFGGQTSERDGAPADPELLMEVMELREALSGAKAARDFEAVGRLSREVAEKEEREKAVLRKAFEALASGSHDALPVAGHALSRLRYYRRFQDEVALLEEDALG